MDIFSVFKLFGGLAFFLFGMQVMSGNLEKLAGGKLEATLKKITSNIFKAMLLGAGITIAIQSSSASTVMLVGLVNSGLMELRQTIGVIMGANIGTTLTAWLLSLAGIESDNVFVRLLKPEAFSPVIAFIGILLFMLSKNQKKKNVGEIMIGFAVLMFGMQLMSASVSPLGESESFKSLLLMFNNPLLGVLVGAAFTGIIQSSAASVAILQALSITGSLSYGMALPIIMGQNIGTCATALISSIGANKNGKRVAAIHTYYNVIGTVFCLIIYSVLVYIFKITAQNAAISPFGIAVSHSIFNIFTTIILLPFTGMLEKLAVITVKDKTPPKKELVFIDERLFATPSFAIAECRNLAVKMSQLALDTIRAAITQLQNFDSARSTQIIENEDVLDLYEDKLGGYLVRLSGSELSLEQSEEISELLHSIGDFERIGDHAVNLQSSAEEMHDKQIRFSAEAVGELTVATDALNDILSLTMRAFKEDDISLAKLVEPLEQVIDLLKADIKNRHISRLLAGTCTIELGFVLSDILANYERVSDHCSNIAVYVIQNSSEAIDSHAYLNDIKSGEASYVRLFEHYKQRYQLPEIK